MFRYLSVKWIHESPDDPVCLFSEIDETGWETRKVEQFEGGHLDFASHSEQSGSTRLGTARIPNIEQIAADEQFIPTEITKDEFELLWKQACGD